ncbi:MAG: hypothetical protein KatS3mg029_0450 [Saprospiraceae bacterium]|nr:MAG: hypothetical protein KatS3mg029_0450 [Saprospiraceae bacterium]
MKKVNSVDEYIARHAEWEEALTALRNLLQRTELEETLKWGAPVYTLAGKHVVGLGAFKGYVGLWFFQGALLSDPKGLLINAQEGTTKALRQMRFQSAGEIDQDVVMAYVNEAILNQRKGREIKPAKAGSRPLEIPVELQQALDADPALHEAFQSLNLTRQRECAEYVGSVKQEKTRQQRLEKVIPLILEGRSPNDKYRK